MGFAYWLAGLVMGLFVWFWYWGRRPMLVVALVVGVMSVPAVADDAPVGPVGTVADPVFQAGLPYAVMVYSTQGTSAGQLFKDLQSIEGGGFTGANQDVFSHSPYAIGSPSTVVAFPLYDFGEYWYGSIPMRSRWSNSGGHSGLLAFLWTKAAPVASVTGPNGQTVELGWYYDAWVGSGTSLKTASTLFPILHFITVADGSNVSAASTWFVGSSVSADSMTGISLFNVPVTGSSPTTNPTTEPSEEPHDENPEATTKPWADTLAERMEGTNGASLLRQVETKQPAWQSMGPLQGVGAHGGLPGLIASNFEEGTDAGVVADIAFLVNGTDSVAEYSVPGEGSSGGGGSAGQVLDLAAFKQATNYYAFILNGVHSWVQFKADHPGLFVLIQTVNTGLVCWGMWIGLARMVWWSVSPASAGAADMLKLEE